MPIYEYYCPSCDARFSHLAGRFGAPPPPCPGCGSREVQKMVSRVHPGRSESARRASVDDRVRQVNQDDPRELARFLQSTGSLADDVLPVDKELFREMVDRRAQGASDEDLKDVVDAFPIPDHAPPHGDHHDPKHEHAHPGEKPAKRSRRQARDLGWA
jgi:putative FmdB family regulatory protein